MHLSPRFRDRAARKKGSLQKRLVANDKEESSGLKSNPFPTRNGLGTAGALPFSKSVPRTISTAPWRKHNLTGNTEIPRYGCGGAIQKRGNDNQQRAGSDGSELPKGRLDQKLRIWSRKNCLTPPKPFRDGSSDIQDCIQLTGGGSAVLEASA